MPLQPHFKLFIEGRATLTREEARDLMRQSSPPSSEPS